FTTRQRPKRLTLRSRKEMAARRPDGGLASTPPNRAAERELPPGFQGRTQLLRCRPAISRSLKVGRPDDGEQPFPWNIAGVSTFLMSVLCWPFIHAGSPILRPVIPGAGARDHPPARRSTG